MRKNFIIATAAAMMAVTAGAADIKVAVCDMSKVVKEFPEARNAEATLEKQMKEYEQENDQMIKELEKKKADFDSARKEAEDKALSEDEKDNKVKAAEERLLAYKSYERQLRETVEMRQKQVADQKLRMSRRIILKLKEVIAKYSAEKDYTIVLDSSSEAKGTIGTVLYSRDSIDVTEDVVKIVQQIKDESPAGAAKDPAGTK